MLSLFLENVINNIKQQKCDVLKMLLHQNHYQLGTMFVDIQDLTILIVDDTEEDFMLINLAFHKCNFSKKVIWMPNGEKVLEYLNCKENFVDSVGKAKPLIIFLDLNMPRMNGFEVLQEIRAHESEHVKKIPVIIFSSSSSRKDINQGYLEGANLYITKPSTYPNLLDFVNSFTKFWTEFCAVPT